MHADSTLPCPPLASPGKWVPINRKLLQGPKEGRRRGPHRGACCSHELPKSDTISPTTLFALLISPPVRGFRWEGTLMGKGTLTLRFPSAVIRSRLQVPQKCSDMDVMKLTWPRKPGILKLWGEEGKKGSVWGVYGWRRASAHQLTPWHQSPHSQPSRGSLRKGAPKALRRQKTHTRMTPELPACAWPAREQTWTEQVLWKNRSSSPPPLTGGGGVLQQVT